MLPPSMEAASSATVSPALSGGSARALRAPSLSMGPQATPNPGARARALRTLAFRATVELCRARLAAAGSGRFARIAAVLIAAGTFVIALSLRVTDGPATPVGGLLRKAAIATAWMAGGAIALAASRDAESVDRAEGVEALVAARGVGAGLLRAARTLGGMTLIGRTVGVPLAVLALGTAGLAPDVASALRRVVAGVALLLWGVIVAVTLGALAAASARFFRARGATALVVLVIGERLIADAAGLGAWSVPGALEAALSIALGATGVGGGR